MVKSETSSRTQQSRWSALDPVTAETAARLPGNQSRGWHLHLQQFQGRQESEQTRQIWQIAE